MRAELLNARSERDASHKDSMVSKRSSDRLKEEVETLRKDKERLQNDKERLECEVRSARTLADNLSKLGSSSSKNEELDVQKHKVKDLETQLEAMKARLVETNKELRELQLYRDRNEAKERLEVLKATGNDSSSNPAKKRPRKLYSIK